MIYRISGFRGIDQSVAENALDPAYSPDACNMETQDGDLAVAKGYTRFLEAPVPGSGAIHRMYVWERIEGTRFIVAAGNALYVYDAEGQAWVKFYEYEEEIASEAWDFQVSRIGERDYLIIANGQSQLVKWDGETASAFGSGETVYESTVSSVSYNMDRASAATYAASDGVGTFTLTMPSGWAYAAGCRVAFTVPGIILNTVTSIQLKIGGKTYALNYVPAWLSGETAVVTLVSATAAEVSLDTYGASAAVLAQAVPDAWKQRALDIGLRIGGVTRGIAAVDGATVTFQDAEQGIEAGDAVSLRGGLSNMAVNFIELHSSRLFAAGDAAHPSRLYWSQPAGDTRSIEDWSQDEVSAAASGGHVEVGNTSQEPIVGLCSLSNQLLIFKRSSIYRLLGSTPEDFNIVQVNWKTEQACNTGIVKYGDVPFWLTNSGMYYHNGNQPTLAGNARMIRNILAGCDLTHSKAVESRDRLYFTCRMDGQGGADDAIIVYNMVEKTYMLRRGFSAVDLASSLGRVYLINDQRYVYLFNDGETYDGAPIHAYWVTPESDLQQKDTEKTIRKLYLRGEGESIVITTKVGRAERENRWYLPQNAEEVLNIPLLNSGRTFRLRIENEAGNWFRLLGGIEIHFDERTD